MPSSNPASEIFFFYSNVWILFFKNELWLGKERDFKILVNEVISLIDQAMSMEPPTTGMIRVVLQGKFVQVNYYYGRGARVLTPITFFASYTHPVNNN